MNFEQTLVTRHLQLATFSYQNYADYQNKIVGGQAGGNFILHVGLNHSLPAYLTGDWVELDDDLVFGSGEQIFLLSGLTVMEHFVVNVPLTATTDVEIMASSAAQFPRFGSNGDKPCRRFHVEHFTEPGEEVFGERGDGEARGYAEEIKVAEMRDFLGGLFNAEARGARRLRQLDINSILLEIMIEVDSAGNKFGFKREFQHLLSVF